MTEGRRRVLWTWLVIVLTCVAGGILVLHPLTMVVYWFEFHPVHTGAGTIGDFVFERTRAGFERPMVGMTGVFALLGVLLGVPIVLATRVLVARDRRVESLKHELGRGIRSLIMEGESETLEFKASARWDRGMGALNRTLEAAVVRSMAGLMNHRGGSLLIGVADTGEVVGIELDLATLRRRDRDGFEQFIVGLAERSLGAAACSYLHVTFARQDGNDVCRVVLEQARRPVYFTEGRTARYFVRVGNTTRELDARETVAHVAERARAPDAVAGSR